MNLEEIRAWTTQKFFCDGIARVSHVVEKERHVLPLLATTTPQPFIARL
jgi:hypothetical protein